jgi:TonB-linked SusC/RagA family outer membrane protein
MKLKYKILIGIYVFFFWQTSSVFAQDKNQLIVKVIVVDEAKSAVQGLSVRTSGSKQLAFTDGSGKLALQCQMNDYLIIENIGYDNLVLPVLNGLFARDTIVVHRWGDLRRSETDKYSTSLSEQSFDRTTGAVSQISGDELKDVPTVFINEALAGRLSGVRAFESDANPETENHSISLWGNTVSEVRIDGMPGGYLPGIGLVETPEEIEKLTIVKDFSGNSLFGGTANDGSMLIKTKKGKPGANFFRIKYNRGLRTPTMLPEMMNAVDYSKANNQALINDGLIPVYPENAIAAYQNGSNPLRFPNVDFYDKILAKTTMNDNLTGDFSGGNSVTTYYSHLGLRTANGLEKVGANRKYSRLTMKTNIETKLGSFGLVYIGIGGNITNRKYPNIGSNTIFNLMNQYPANAMPLLVSDGIYGYNPTYPTNMLADLESGVKSEDAKREGYTRIGIDFDLDDLLKGLTFKSSMNISVYNSNIKGLDPTVDRLQPLFTTPTNQDTLYYRIITKKTTDNSWSQRDNAVYRSRYLQTGFNYDRAFEKDHLLTADIIFTRELITGSDFVQDERHQTFGGRMNYFFKNRYTLDASISTFGVQAIPGKNRNALAYHGGLAWIVSREQFLKNIKWLDYWKLRTSYGVSGTWFGQVSSDARTYYITKDLYNDGNGSSFGVPGATSSITGYYRAFTGNAQIKCPQQKMITVGSDAQLFNKSLNLQLNYFYKKLSDEIILPSNLYALLASNTAYMPYINYGSRASKGLDFQITYNNKIGQIQYTLDVNGVYRLTKNLKTNSLKYSDDDSYRSTDGQFADNIYGLESDGLYQSKAEVENSLFSYLGSIFPGDIKYKDFNGDKVIDNKDIHVIGHSPRFQYGLNMTFKYKNWWLSIHGDGVADGELIDQTNWRTGNKNYTVAMKQAWPVSNDLPVTTVIGTNANYRTSTFWLKKAGYFNIRSLNLAYMIPSELTRRAHIENIKVYLSGRNLFVKSMIQNMYAPNVNSGYSVFPALRGLDLGIELSF